MPDDATPSEYLRFTGDVEMARVGGESSTGADGEDAADPPGELTC